MDYVSMLYTIYNPRNVSFLLMTREKVLMMHYTTEEIPTGRNRWYIQKV